MPSEPINSSFREHTYIRRRGRMTKAQMRAFDELVADYSSDTVSLHHNRCVGIEIGFGMGRALLDWAQTKPEWQLFGIELYQPGVGALVDGLHKREIDNVRVLQQPAQLVCADIDCHVVDEVRIFFPDPWPKKRHHKRRLVQVDFIHDLARIVKPHGKLHLATDWSPYADWMREVLAQVTSFLPTIDCTRQADTPSQVEEVLDSRVTTNFERRGQKLGHEIHDLIYRRKVVTEASEKVS